MHGAFIDTMIPSDPRALLKPARERAGLRGPVKTCVEEYPGRSYSYSVTWEYTFDGKLLIRRIHSNESEWVTTQIYDTNGRLTKILSGKVGEPASESLYTYDELGRLVTITDIPAKGCRVDFEFDSEGRKTATQTFAPEILERKGGVAVDGSFWNAAVSWGIGVPVGGKITTIYDKNGLPTESRILDAKQQVVRRFLRANDAEGRITEEKWLWENPSLDFLAGIPAEQKAQLTPEQVRQANEAFANVYFKSQEGMSYTYDAQGRLRTTVLRFSVLDSTTEIEFNEHGDEAMKQQKLTPNSARLTDFRSRIEKNFGSSSTSSESPGPKLFSRGLPDKSTIESYAYQYDGYGNWTQKSVTASYRPNESVVVSTRQLTYY